MRLRPLPLSLALALFTLVPFTVGAQAPAQRPGEIQVTVSQRATGQFLDRARVELVGADRAVNTDAVGVAEFGNVAPGSYEVLATYPGLEPQRMAVTVQAGRISRVPVEMDLLGVIELEEVVVTAERWGQAAAIARQQHAPNIENIIAMDALGRLANDNPSELLIRLPGVTSGFSTEGAADNVMIRGMSAEASSVNVDDAPITSAGALSRAGVFTSMAAINFDEIQVTKALLPNMPADSVGGRINFKTRPPFDMRAKRGVSVNIAAKWNPSFFDYSPRRESPSLTPDFSLHWRELYSVFGERRNLGLSSALSYNENITQSVRTISRMDITAPQPRFTYALERRDRVLDRIRTSGNLRLDYKFSDDAKMSVNYLRNTLHQYGSRSGKFIYDVVASMNSRHRVFQSEDPTNGAIMAGSTEQVTLVRPRGNTYLETITDPSGAADSTHFLRFNGDFRLGPWTVDWNASGSRSVRTQMPRGARYNHAGNRLVGRRNNIGWILDKTESVEFPTFTQTDGPSIFDPDNYTLTLTQRIIDAENENLAGRLDLRRDTELFGRSVRVRTGLNSRRQSFQTADFQRLYTYQGTDKARFVGAFPTDSRIGIEGLPVWDPAKYGSSLEQEPHLWSTNEFNTLASARAGLRDVSETIHAGYGMGEMLFGPLNVLAGARIEWTRSSATGYRRSELEDTRNYTSLDEVNRAYPRMINYRRDYTDVFPSVHLRYALGSGWQVRASVSTSIARPEIDDLLPSYSVSVIEQRVSLNNPDLKPSYAWNYDLALEYYMRRVGLITVGVFRKDIRDFIFRGNLGEIEDGVDYGFDSAAYVGYDLFTVQNGRTGRVDGVELAYANQLTFLPGPLGGLGFSGNYTRLRASGDYGDGNEFALVGFIPETANARLSYHWRQITVYSQWTYRGRTPASYAERPQQRVTTLPRTFFGAGVSWRINRQWEAYIDGHNLLDAPARTIQDSSGTRMSTNYNGPIITVGVGARF